MRLIPIAAALCVVAAPAAAQHRTPESDVARRMADPVVQDGAAAAISALAGIVLDTRVGPLARWTDPRDDIRPNDTLRDLKRREDPNFERHLHNDARRTLATAGAAAGDLAAMMGELRHTADRLQAAVAPIAGAYGAPAYDDYDDGY
ncbi:hypothetical protein M9980_13925 [Sphingomonas donggukensis]|uniref:LTXXQ motif family protein n=1 Tax=Sphingomonas donggukensis TaxID=2949093 RepID=A0ABY4TT70_9SPHN|nr:hypothetical protein [Sphingomonas donggukensis]URW75599.1 hypothetical protein M9980_13925 [Sphingomonas donggukensis]